MATEANNRLFDGRYLILRKLGSGGMAEVYLAEDQELGRKVALKMLNERHARDEQFVERFKREARNAAGLSHPHIVRIYDRGQAEGTYYIAMEYLDGPTLKELLVRRGPTPPLMAIKFAREILSALAEAHRHEIVHRDIKPHNVIVGRDWEIKVTDFGIARSGASQMTEVGSIVGTAQYLSPEQARGAPVDQRSDLYSLGIVMYEMLTGKVPFTGEAAVEIAMKHLSAVPEPPSKLRPEVPHSLDAVVMRALAKDPDQRYASAEEMDADLARVARGAAVSQQTEEAMTQVLSGTGLASAATVAQRPPGPPSPPAPIPPAYRPLPTGAAPPRRRRSPWPALLGLLALVIAAAGGYLIYQRVEATIDGSSTVAVPDVRNILYGNAELLLKNQGLLYRITHQSSSTIPADFVIRQAPGPGQKAKKKTVVLLTVSTGKPVVTVPSVTGDSLQSAESRLTALGLRWTIFRHNSGAPVGSVTAQSPASGSSQTVGTAIQLNVSTGPKTVGVPNVLSEPYANAASTLRGAGFVPAEVTANSSQPVGTVIAQAPQPDSLEPPRTTVTLTVSKGPKAAAVPDVVGDDIQDASQLLTQQGFLVSVVHQSVSIATQNGLVLAQNPQGGSRLAEGGTVTVTVGSLVTPTTTPTAPATTAATTTTAQTTPTTTAAATTATTTTTTTTTTTSATTTQTSTTQTSPAITTPAVTTTQTSPATTPSVTTTATTTQTTTTPAATQASQPTQSPPGSSTPSTP